MGYAGEKLGNEIVGLAQRKDTSVKDVSSQKQLDELIVRAVRWGLQFYKSVHVKSGDPNVVLNSFSEESIVTMVKNNINLTAYEDQPL